MTDSVDDAAQKRELYNRQEYVVGAAAQARYGATHVLVVGAANGLAAELVKNLVLTGVGQVDILDDSPVQPCDAGTNFFVRPDGNGVNTLSSSLSSRANVMAAAAQHLNRFVKVRAVQDATRLQEHMAAAHVVVFVNARTAHLCAENAWARQHGVGFVSCESRGVAGCVFVDAGDLHEVVDRNGEETVSCVVTALTSGGVVTLLEGKSHDCEVGSEVYFTGLTGAPELNTDKGSCAMSREEACQEAHSEDEDDTATTTTNSNNEDDDEEGEGKDGLGNGGVAHAPRLFRVREVISPQVLVLEGFPAALQTASPSSSSAGAIAVDELIAVGTRAYLHTTKRRAQLHFDDLATALLRPSWMNIFDSPAKMNAPALLHALFRAVAHVRNYTANTTTNDNNNNNHNHNNNESESVMCSGKYAYDTTPLSNAEMNEVLRVASTYMSGDASSDGCTWEAETAAAVLRVFHGDLNPMDCLIGAMAAQEVLKVCSGSFTPVQQWMYYDARELLAMAELARRDKPAVPNNPDDEAACAQACHHSRPAQHHRQQYHHDAAKHVHARRDDRFAGQVAVLGSAFQSFLRDCRVFIVGAGALGCEHIKNVALMGLGGVSITDMDTIERSNLSRQFLFRDFHIGCAKSTVAGDAARALAPWMDIASFTTKVDAESEGVFDESFWSRHSVVLNALDNVASRKYVDGRCLFYQLPLLESGTLGTKCNMQPVIPYVTESYGSSFDPPERSIPLCTLKNFPHAIEHTIQWARDLFQRLFVTRAQDVNRYLDDPAHFVASLRSDPASAPEVQAQVCAALTQWPQSCADCVRLARMLYEEHLHRVLAQLLYSFPRDKRNEDGTRFWSGGKKPPTPPRFDPHCRRDVAFVFHTAALLAQGYGLHRRWPLSWSQTAALAAAVVVPDFVPSQTVTYAEVPTSDATGQNRANEKAGKDGEGNAPFAVGEEEGGGGVAAVESSDEPAGKKGRRVESARSNASAAATGRMTSDEDNSVTTSSSIHPHHPHDNDNDNNNMNVRDGAEWSLPCAAAFGTRRMHALEFEKDDLTNHHVQFVTYASNIRAEAYGIPPATVHQTRRIAGNIIPAMVTTTALVTGLVGLEMLKYLLWQFHHSDASACANHTRTTDEATGLASEHTEVVQPAHAPPAVAPTPEQLPRLLTLYRSAFVNVALPFMAFSDPIVADGRVYTLPSGRVVRWGVWDRLDVNEGVDVTVEKLVGLLSARYELEIFMITLVSGKMLYSYFGGSAKDRVKPVSEVAWQKGEEQQEGNDYLNLVVSGVIGEDEDVDIPVVRYKYRNF